MRKWLAEHPKVIAVVLLVIVVAIISAFYCFVISDKPMDFEDFLLCTTIELGIIGIIIWMMSN